MATLTPVSESTSPLVNAAHLDNATYDPTSVTGDVFNMDNMAEGTTKKILTATERTNIATSKTHSDSPHGGSRALASQAEAEAGSDNVKGMTPLRVSQAIDALGGVDATNVAAAIVSANAKTTPVAADTFPLIDSEDSSALKEITLTNLIAAVGGGGGDTTVLQNNISLNAFRIAINGGLSVQNMQDGFVDEFEDETGVDTGASTNEVYDAGANSYSPTPGEAADTLLHFDGADTSTTITDDGSKAKTWTANGNAQIDTSQSQFGGASLLLDGTGDTVTTPDHDDFNFGSGDFTIDCWIRPTTAIASQVIVAQYGTGGVGTKSAFYFRIDGNGKLNMEVFSASTQYGVNGSTTLSDNTRVHAAFVRNGNTGTLYLGGTSEGTPIDLTGVTLFDSSEPITIGDFGNSGGYFGGHTDELRIVKGTAVWTSDFTPPTNPYDTTPANMTLVSNSIIAVAQPDTASIILFEEDDGITLNTDLIAKVSRDGGTTLTAVTLVDQGNYESGKRILQGEVDISGQPAGTDLEYEITTANNIGLIIHGAALQWA